MDNLIGVAFLAGLTTGGLSCMAVQGGLLTTSLARQIEADMNARGKKKVALSGRDPRLARPILLFLLAKLVTYTLLGFLLGALGSVLSLTPMSRGILQIAIAVFMLGNGLRMLNVHPIFRLFNVEPPAGLRRWLRQYSKKEGNDLAPLLLGLLTVLIPCGVTQSMMAVAVGSGSPWMGAAILFAFTLGASPLFFGLVYLATRLGGLMERYFMRLVAVALLILGLVTLDGGLGLVGSPFIFSRLPEMARNALGAQEGGLQIFDLNGGGAGPLKMNGEAEDGVVKLAVTNSGYEPTLISAPADEPLILRLTTKETYSCARAFVIPVMDYSVLLDESGTVEVEIPAQPKGTKLRFSCSMGMYTGTIVFN
jgi:sulfite exporter TauE/SafE